MKRHPLPRNITSYQFHLIGSMTLKQFLLLTGGLLGAWIFWSITGLYIFRLPLALASALIGVMFAFIPYQDRSLDQWLTTFIKAIYHPTHYFWKKNPQLPNFLQPKIKPHKIEVIETKTSPSSKKSLAGYLQSLPQSPIQSQLDAKLNQDLKSITQLLNTIQSPKNITTKPISPPEEIIKNVKVKVRKLKSPPPDFRPGKDQLITPANPLAPSTQTSPSSPKVTSFAPSGYASKTSSQSQSVSVVVNPKLPFPSAPTTPNIIVGMTLDPKRNILESTIIEIRNTKGHPVRALKSNKLGQFFIGTPLPNDTYKIVPEKNGYIFDTTKIILKGKIVPLIELKAKSKTPITTKATATPTPTPTIPTTSTSLRPSPTL